MDIVRARGQDPETCRELFILAAEILGVAAYSGSALSARLDELGLHSLGRMWTQRLDPATEHPVGAPFGF